MKNRLFRCGIILFLVISSTTFCFASLPDIQYHWSRDVVHTLFENNIVKGYADGRFRPDHFMTKGEFSALLKSFERQQSGATQGALQVEQGAADLKQGAADQKQGAADQEQGAADQKQGAADQEQGATDQEQGAADLEQGAADLKQGAADLKQGAADQERGVDGLGAGQKMDRLEDLDAFLTREVMAQMLYDYKTKQEGYVFQEAVGDLESYPLDLSQNPSEMAIKALYQEGIINGYKDKTFRPQNHVTRAEVCAALFKMSNLELLPMEVTLPRYKWMKVPYISQIYPVSAPVGCEGTSLLMGLKAKGYAADVDLKTFLNGMPKDSQNPARGFVGSPYKADRTKRTRTTIYPEKLVEYGNKYGNILDFSGSSIQEIQAELLCGNPVVVYATLYWGKPFYRSYIIDNQQVKLLSNNHVVLVAGYNIDENKYFICDPYNKKEPKEKFEYWIDGTTFENIYNERKQAIVIE